MRFTATLQLDGRTATGIEVPAEVVEALGGGRRPAVRVALGDYRYRSTLAVRAGVFKLPVSAEHRAGAGVAAGDTVEVDIELDREPRTVDVPADLAAALDAEPPAAAFFAGLTASQQRVHVVSIESAKTEETRGRRVEKAMAMLREGRKR